MKYNISSIIGLTSIFLCCTISAYNFDDNAWLLKRMEAKRDLTPPTGEETGRLKSLLKNGKLKLVNQERNSLSEVKDDSAPGARALKRAGVGKKRTAGDIGVHKARGSRNSGARNAPANAKKGKPRSQQPAEKTGRNGPQRGSNPKSAQNAGRNKPEAEETGRHHYYYDDDYYLGDDYYYGKGKGYYYDDYFGDDYYADDTYYADDYYGGGDDGLSYVEMVLQGFQDGRSLQDAIPPHPSLPDEFDAGTLYLWNKEPVYGIVQDFFGNSTTGIVVDESDKIASVTGRCIRTDPHDELDFENYLGRAYCQFVYTFGSPNDPVPGFDEFTAEGPVQLGQEAILTVTGGIGIYTRTVGEIILSPADPNFLASDPPAVEFSLDEDLPASYYMEAFIFMDERLIPSDVMF